MARKISVPVLCNSNGLYLNNTQTIDATAQVIGIQSVPDKLYPPGAPKSYIDTLFVNDVMHGGLYLQLTQNEYNDLVRAASQDPNKNIVFVYVVPTDIPTGIYIERPEFYNTTILAVTKNGTGLNKPMDYIIQTDTVAQTTRIKLTAPLVDTDVVNVTLYND